MARMMKQNEAEAEAKITAADPTVIKREGKAGEGKNAAGKSIVMAAPLVDKSSSAAAAKATETKSPLPLTTQLVNSKQLTEEMEVGMIDVSLPSVYSDIPLTYIFF